MTARLSDYTAELRGNMRAAIDFARLGQVLAVAKGNNALLLQTAQRMFGTAAPRVLDALRGMATSPRELGELYEKTVVAAGDTLTTACAGVLAAQNTLGSEFAEYLRPLTALGRLNTRKVPFNFQFPRATSGSGAAFIGQGTAIKVSKLDLDSVTLGIAKLAGLVVITDELAANSNPSVSALLSNDLAAACAAELDRVALDPGTPISQDVNLETERIPSKRAKIVW